MTAKTSRSRNTISSLLQYLIVLMVSTGFLAGCSFPGLPISRHELQIDPENIWSTETVNLQLKLLISEQLSAEESIMVEILDEVSGTSAANQSFELDKVTQFEYTTNLSLPAGSVLKYRYVKIGQNYLPEGQFNGDPVQYRLYLAQTDSAVNDILHAWQGGVSRQGLGAISGCVKDQATGLSIADILVSAGGQTTISDANGAFVLGGLPQGEHNLMFYAMDGKYGSFQQGAIIDPGKTTEANVELQMRTPVQVRFSVKPPEEAFGAPVYIAGNIFQLGNTFSDNTESSSVFPKQMPILTLGEDGNYSLELTLYSGTDLRFKFTLGDGYWNSEQRTTGGLRTRQLIVPNQDIHLSVNIESWKEPNFSPVTFRVSIPSTAAPQDDKFIQLKSKAWSQPIPLWPVGNDEFLYILFSPFQDQTPISYRFCRNANCTDSVNEQDDNTLSDFFPSTSEINLTTTINSWKNWHEINVQSDLLAPPIPVNSYGYNTAVELSPEMDHSWLSYAPAGIDDIAEMGTRSLLFSPQWYLRNVPPFISAEIGITPYTYEINQLLDYADSTGLRTGLYPQLSSEVSVDSWWLSQATSPEWWEEWFNSYRKFILNYAAIAEEASAEQLIIGGKSTIPTFIGGIFPDGSETDAPETSDVYWQEILQDVRTEYSGKIVWAMNVNQRVDPLPEFIDQFDGIYVIIDSPLSNSNNASFEEIAFSFTSVIDNFIYEIHRITQMPLSVGLGYPSVDGAARGCTILRETCFNDGLFLSSELSDEKVDLAEQALIYASILPVVASRNWVTGTVIRGYLPTVIVQDGSSSIAGKPASTLISDWMSLINNDQD